LLRADNSVLFNKINCCEGSDFGDLEGFPDTSLAVDLGSNNDISNTGCEQGASAEFLLEFHATEEAAFDELEIDIVILLLSIQKDCL